MLKKYKEFKDRGALDREDEKFMQLKKIAAVDQVLTNQKYVRSLAEMKRMTDSESKSKITYRRWNFLSWYFWIFL